MNTPGNLNSPVVNTRGVLTPSGEHIGESWLPVVDFLVYFEQASEQVYKKASGDERPGSQDSSVVLVTGEPASRFSCKTI
jgi:hypothetical protein